MPRLFSFHPALTICLPALFLAIQAVLEIYLPNQVLSIMLSENGPHETLQVLVIALAGFVALSCLWKAKGGKDPFLFCWLLCFLMACIYIAGEEISWGQHFVEWTTPEFWSRINDQNETNLHNTSSWLDQKPRIILLIGILTGGLVFPLLERFRPEALPARFRMIYPAASLSFLAFCVLTVEFLDKLDKILKDVVIMARASEVEELLMFYFVLLYLVELRRRILKNQR